MTARKLCLQVRWHFRQRSLYVTRPRSLRKKDSSSFLFFGILGMVLLKQKSAHFSRNSRNRRIADFSVVFRGDFQEKNGHRAARKSPVVLRIGQTMPYRIVVFRYQFGVHFRRFSLMSFPAPGSHNGVFAPFGTLVAVMVPPFPAASHCATSPGSISHTGRSFDWNNPSMN